MLAVALATDRDLHVRRGCREERRGQRQHEQQQKRDGYEAAHERPGAAMSGKRPESVTGFVQQSCSCRLFEAPQSKWRTLNHKCEMNEAESVLEARRLAREGHAFAMLYRGQSVQERRWAL